MKKVMFALCFAMGGAVLVNAQDTTSNQYRTDQPSQYPQEQQMPGQQMQQDRQRIQTSELPDAVKRSLEDQEYRGWLVSGAFKASASDSTGISGDQNQQGNNNAIGTEDEEIYIVELKNGAETKSVAFDKDGQRIEGWQDQSDQYNQQNHQYNPNDPNQSDQQMNDQNHQWDQNQSTEPNQLPEPTTPPDQSTQPQDQSSQSDQQATSPDQSGQSSPSDQR